MDLQYVGQNIELTDFLKNYAHKRVSKLSKFFSDHPEEEVKARIKLSVEGDRQIAEIQINSPGNFFEGKYSSPDMYASIDEAVNKLARQLRQFHDRQKNYRKKDPENRSHKMASKIYDLSLTGDGEDPQVVHRTTFTAKPMSTDEAVLQMDSLDYSFLVFTNQVTDEINVVYRRDDGKYGLIEAEPH